MVPNDIFQFSTISALMAGLCGNPGEDYGPSISQLPGYGTHGLGTLTNINGEVLYLDGKAWHITTRPAKGRDGGTNGTDQEALNEAARTTHPTIRLADTNEHLPFVQVTPFRPRYSSRTDDDDQPGPLTKDGLLDYMTRRSGGTHNHHQQNSSNINSSNDSSYSTGGPNSFIPFQITGRFTSLTLRIGGPKLTANDTLAEVTARAPQWRLRDVDGTVFGFLSPAWTDGISVSGFHGHFIEDQDEDGDEDAENDDGDDDEGLCDDANEDDDSGKDRHIRRGGHVLDFEAGGTTTTKEAQVEVSWDVTGRFHLGMPAGTEAWERADLMVNAKGIDEAQNKVRPD